MFNVHLLVQDQNPDQDIIVVTHYSSNRFNPDLTRIANKYGGNLKKSIIICQDLREAGIRTAIKDIPAFSINTVILTYKLTTKPGKFFFSPWNFLVSRDGIALIEF